jgi:hypothetical protein
MIKASSYVLEPRGVDERLDLHCIKAQHQVHLPLIDTIPNPMWASTSGHVGSASRRVLNLNYGPMALDNLFGAPHHCIKRAIIFY